MKNSNSFSVIAAAFAAVALGACNAKHDADAEAVHAAASAQLSILGNQITVPAGSPMLNQIRVSPVEAAQVPAEEVDAPGKIEANPDRLSHVALPLSGRVASVLVHVGDAVERGQTVLLIESPDADAAMSTYMQAEASLNGAKSAVLKAQADYDRARDLFQNSAVAQKDVLNAESALAQAKATQESAMAVKEQADRKLALFGLKHDQYGQKLQVKAPISGKVLELSVAPNEYRNDTNASLMTIADLSEVWVSSDVPETKIRLIRRGEPVDVELEAFPGQTFHARVKRIADSVDPATRTIKVQAELANPHGLLRPEMFGRIRHVGSLTTLPVIPLTALVQGEGRSSVYREIGQGRFEMIPVELGSRREGEVAVTSGLRAGDRIVTDGAMLLKAP
jgi:cobalt-zinc-cadmium efflux system membrane fusion protein